MKNYTERYPLTDKAETLVNFMKSSRGQDADALHIFRDKLRQLTMRDIVTVIVHTTLKAHEGHDFDPALAAEVREFVRGCENDLGPEEWDQPLPAKSLDRGLVDALLNMLGVQGIIVVETKEVQGRFEPGQVVTTPKIHNAIQSGFNPAPYFYRHLRGDWGEIDEADKNLNDKGVDYGGRLVSRYETEIGPLLIITEADRSATTLLTPEEY